MIRRALLSAWDKAGIVDFGRGLQELGVSILSTGGTARALRDAGVTVREVSDETGFPEMMGGRVKTLHPRVHGGILALRDEPAHRRALEEHGITPIDLVAVNLYPFEATLAAGASCEETVEQIDVGGPTMLRSAAKNHRYVTVIVDPQDYTRVLDAMRGEGGIVSESLRLELAAKAFRRMADYDARIAGWLSGRANIQDWPERLVIAGQKMFDMRYGENPHQTGAFYAHEERGPSLGRARILGGKALSYTNVLDLDAALRIVEEFDEPACAVIKHANACGAGRAKSAAEAFVLARNGDPVSAFGSVVGLNRPVDETVVERLLAIGNFFEGILAPSFIPSALERIRARKGWGAKVRLLAIGPLGPRTAAHGRNMIRWVRGGFLAQEVDVETTPPERWQIATQRAPTSEETRGLHFAEILCKHTKSNAIVFAKSDSLVGVGAGQMSRVDAVRIASRKAGAKAKGAVMASDAFFPFPDGIEAAAEAGITAVLQPGGSVKDKIVIQAAERMGLAMVFTGRRHFLH